MLAAQGSRNCQQSKSDVSQLFSVCWYSWFGRLSNATYRYRKSISIIETFSIYNIYFGPFNTANIVSYLTTVRPAGLPRFDEAFLNNHEVWYGCDAIIQVKWVLFRVAMHRYSVIIPYFTLLSAKLRCLKSRAKTQGGVSHLHTSRE